MMIKNLFKAFCDWQNTDVGAFTVLYFMAGAAVLAGALVIMTMCTGGGP